MTAYLCPVVYIVCGIVKSGLAEGRLSRFTESVKHSAARTEIKINQILTLWLLLLA